MKPVLRHAYYVLKPLIPRWLQVTARQAVARIRRPRLIDVWPILPSAGTPPTDWKGWPEGKKFAFVLTHDVDTQRGHDRCADLADLEKELGFRSSFNFVPERYDTAPGLRARLFEDGFEVGVHGLCHDGKYYVSREKFQERANKINAYLSDWGAVGYRSPSMQHNLEWHHMLNVEYDASTFDTDPFEPQSVGVGTIFPFIHRQTGGSHSYVELPYTLVQDFTLFIMLGERDTSVWKKKVEWVRDRGGMALLNTHPDYMVFRGKKAGLEEYPAVLYGEFLGWVKDRYGEEAWSPLPRDLASFWRTKYGDNS